MVWTKLINKNEETTINDILYFIYLGIKNKEFKTPGLIGGDVGMLLFLHEYYKYCKNEEIIGLLQEDLDKALSVTKNSSLTFCNGIAGLGWLLQYFKEEGLFETDINLVCNGIDILLEKFLNSPEAKNNIDFLHGSLGVVYYFVFRENVSFKIIHKKYLDLLEKKSIRSNLNSHIWLDESRGKRVINLGLAHGMPSILAYLLSIYQIGIYSNRILTLIQEIISFLLENRNPKEFRSSFSHIVDIDNTNYQESRLAWCYGDLGVAYLLYRASVVIKDDELSKAALEILKKSTFRRDPAKDGVKDASFCHGSAGIMHMYNRIYNATNEPVFKEASVFWLQDVISKANLKESSPIYKYYNALEGVFKSEYSLLEGTTGIGLALLSVITRNEPLWDKSLLLS